MIVLIVAAEGGGGSTNTHPFCIRSCWKDKGSFLGERRIERGKVSRKLEDTASVVGFRSCHHQILQVLLLLLSFPLPSHACFRSWVIGANSFCAKYIKLYLTNFMISDKPPDLLKTGACIVWLPWHCIALCKMSGVLLRIRREHLKEEARRRRKRQ